MFGVATGFGVMALLSNAFGIPEFATTIGLMIGLGVGIDYALFIVTRYREALGDGFDPRGETAVASRPQGMPPQQCDGFVIVYGTQDRAERGWMATCPSRFLPSSEVCAPHP